MVQKLFCDFFSQFSKLKRFLICPYSNIHLLLFRLCAPLNSCFLLSFIQFGDLLSCLKYIQVSFSSCILVFLSQERKCMQLSPLVLYLGISSYASNLFKFFGLTFGYLLDLFLVSKIFLWPILLMLLTTVNLDSLSLLAMDSYSMLLFLIPRTSFLT